MGYATNADVEARLGHGLYVQLTDDAATGTADESKVSEARLASEAEVNSYLAGRYRVPVDTSASEETATLLRSVTLDLVEWRLHSRRPPVAEDVRNKGAAAVSWLQAVATGQVWLPSATEPAGSEIRGPVAVALGEPRLMSREEMDGL